MTIFPAKVAFWLESSVNAVVGETEPAESAVVPKTKIPGILLPAMVPDALTEIIAAILFISVPSAPAKSITPKVSPD